MFSQHDEEKVILDWFDDKTGRFLDLGAHDGVRFSNTHRLAELGWAGVCVESSPQAFTELIRNYKNNERIELASFAIGLKPSIRKFYASDRPASTFRVNQRDMWEKSKWGIEFRTIYVSVIIPEKLFALFGWHYDFVSIDLNGENLEFFCSLNLGKIGASLICVEHDGDPGRVVRYGEKHGYHKVHRVGPNVLLGKKKCSS